MYNNSVELSPYDKKVSGMTKEEAQLACVHWHAMYDCLIQMTNELRLGYDCLIREVEAESKLESDTFKYTPKNRREKNYA